MRECDGIHRDMNPSSFELLVLREIRTLYFPACNRLVNLRVKILIRQIENLR